ncbi:MAG: PEP-CTERM sorting domain-containing protein [Verrucomicrobia bacterium]|nr:PEP-CTERM sorting domain-containing protein [Verrucomicrobiota bacterium]
MKKLLFLGIGIGIILLAADWGEAQEVRYDLTGTYPSTAPRTSLTAPGGAFDFGFLVPASVPNFTPPNSPFYITAPILSGSYTFGGSTDPVISGTYVFSNSAGNVTDISLTTSLGNIELTSPPPSLGPSVFAGRPDASGQSHFLTGDLGIGIFDPIDFTLTGHSSFVVTGGTLVSIVGASVPEPSSLGLVALGLIAFVGMASLHSRRRLPLTASNPTPKVSESPRREGCHPEICQSAILHFERHRSRGHACEEHRY